MTAQGSRMFSTAPTQRARSVQIRRICSAKNEAMLLRRGFVSRIHRKKPKGKPMPERTRFANAQKSKCVAPSSMCLRIRRG